MLKRCLTSPFSHLTLSRLPAFVIVTLDLYAVDRPDWIPTAELITSRPWVLLRLRDHIGTSRTESLPTNLGHPVFPVEFRCNRLRFPFRTFATYYCGVPVGRSDGSTELSSGTKTWSLSATGPQPQGAIFGIALSSSGWVA
jgi:hypothetical protein